MTGVEIETIVDKLADKLGVAVDKLEPIAQTILDQYVLRAQMLLIFWAITLVACIIASIYGVRSLVKIAESEEDQEGAIIGFGFLVSGCVILGGVSFGLVVQSIGRVCAPLVSVLGL